ncbi:MAG: PIG-L deacetylase family protein [Bryobacteraceae bacterium]
MERRGFLGSTMLAGFGAPSAAQQSASERPLEDIDAASGLTVERSAAGRPHTGKVLAAIQPHSDDIPIFAAGTVLKLLDEGYTGYLVRVTNDDMAGPGGIATTVSANERDNFAVARALGVKQVFDLNYNNHMMDAVSLSELRARFIFLFRLLRVDTVVTYDPWGHYEENPDHYVTSSCVEAACWMAGGSKDYPEHFAAGLKPHSVREKYYFARFQQRINRIVDISAQFARKIDVNIENKAQGPGGDNGVRLRKDLASRNLRLPLLEGDETTANQAYVRQFTLERDRMYGEKYGFEAAEPFHYIGPPDRTVEEYVQKNAIKL